MTSSQVQVDQFVISCIKLEKTNNFDEFLSDIRNNIDQSNSVQVGMLVALSNAIFDSDAVNCWFFQVPVTYTKPLIWLSTVKNSNTPRFVWSVGYIHNVTKTIQDLIKPNLNLLEQIPLLQVPKSPSFLVYFDPVKSSTWQMAPDIPVIENISELDIFQVAYDGDNPIEDVDQTLVMNARFLKDQGTKLEHRVRDFGSQNLIAFCERYVFPKIDLLTALHVEVHNWGHFLGYFPFSDNKNLASYESVEEYRACLVGGLFGIELLHPELSLALCLVIVLNRILIYGFEPYLRDDEDKTFQDVREITVAVLFYQNLQDEGVLTLDSGKFDIDTSQLIATFTKLGFAIQKMEQNTNGIASELERYAIEVFKRAYPNRQFPLILSNFWSKLSQKYYS